jgi:hypothetical protein
MSAADDLRRRMTDLLAAKAVVDKHGAKAAAWDAAGRPDLEETQPIARTVFGDADPLETTQTLHMHPSFTGPFHVVRLSAHGQQGIGFRPAPELSEGLK